MQDIVRKPKQQPAAVTPPVTAPVATPSTPPAVKKERLWEKLGPGLITGAADDDPSGIGTYSVAGAQFGYKTLWVVLITYPATVAVQELCARIGIVTGHGLASTIKKYYGRWILAVLALLLFCANTINIGADLQAMAGTVRLLVPGLPYTPVAIFIAAFTLFLLIFLSYKVYAKYLKLATAALLAYVFVAFLSHVDWPEVLRNFFIPSLTLTPAYIMTLVGVLGTTISPYLFFWQSNEEVEEELSKGIIRVDEPNTNHRSLLHLDKHILTDMREDVGVGILYSQIIMFFIITSTASVIFKTQGSMDFSNLGLDSLANVLRPLVGDTAFALFTFGILGIGLLAVPVLAGSASYAISELFGWKEGLSKKFHQAPGFYLVIILSTVIGLLLNRFGVSPVTALYYTAVINGVVAVPMLIMIWMIGNNSKILGEHKSGWLSNIFMGLAVFIMTGASIALFLYSFIL